MAENIHDPYSVVRVLEDVNNREDRPLYLGGALNPVVRRSTETEFAVQANAGSVEILDYIARGAPLPQNRLNKRKINKIEIPGFGTGFTVNTEQKRDVAARPNELELLRSQTIIDEHLDSVDANLVATAERQLAHAVRGFITNKDEEIVVDLYEELGAEQKTIEIDVTDSKRNWVRQMQPGMNIVDDELQNETAGSYLLLPGNGIGSWLETDAVYNQAITSDVAQRLSLEDNRKGVRISNALSVLPSRRGYFDEFEAHLVPVIPGFFRKILGPSDSEQYDGQILERYVTREAIKHGKGWEYEITSFMLQYARKPGAIIKVKFLGIPGGPTA